MPNTWVVVADRSRARILSPKHEARKPLDQIVEFVGRAGYVGPDKFPAEKMAEEADFVHPESELRPRQVDTDRPGHFMGKNGAPVAGDPETDRRHLTAERFASELVHALDKARLEKRFDKLILIAPPLFLGVLRDKLTPSLAKMVTLEIRKDYTKLKTEEIRKHLPDEL